MEVATARVAGAAWSAGSGGAVNRLRSDRSLAERFQAGDEAAFATLYDRYRARVNAICIGVLGSREDALDATQEVFTTVALKLREEPPRELKPWLAKVARNAALDIARKRRPTVGADHDAVPARPADHHLELQELVGALRELPEQQRTALVMRELGGWSYDEIAASLGVESNAVNGLIARARLGLRAHREAAALVCSAVRETLAGEEDGRRRSAPIRRHLRGCEGCTEFNRAVQSDSQTLQALLPGSGLGVLGAIFALRPRPALLGGVGAAKFAFSGVGVQFAAVCAVGACTIGGMTALDVLPPLPQPLASDKADKPKPKADHTAAAAVAESPGAPPVTATVVAGTGEATAHARERTAPASDSGEEPSIARPGPEGRVPASQPERIDPRRELFGQRDREFADNGPAPFDFEGERDGRGGGDRQETNAYDFAEAEERGGPRHGGGGGGDDSFDQGDGQRGGGDRGGRQDGPQSGGRDEALDGHQHSTGGGSLPDFDEPDVPQFDPEPRHGAPRQQGQQIPGGGGDTDDGGGWESGGGRQGGGGGGWRDGGDRSGQGGRESGDDLGGGDQLADR